MNSDVFFYFVCSLALGGLLYFIYLANNRDAEAFDSRRLPNPNQTILQKHNCDIETIYSFTDQQCESVCSNIGSYVSKHGVCVNVLAFQTSEVQNTCDPKRGVLAYLTGNSQFGSVNLRCLTIDDGIQPSDLTKPNIFCVNGDIDIDYLTSYPQLANCKCRDDNEVLAMIANTNAVRSHGVCVNKKFINFWKINSLLFTKDTI